jgi:thiosulfate/3-mercaptopyruvate sulfurtransferase
MYNHFQGGKMLFNRKLTSVFVAVMFLFCFFPGSHNASANASATYTAKEAPPVVETDWLESNIGKPGIRVAFMDDWPSKKTEYTKKHIPGSVFIGIGSFMGVLGDGSAPPDKTKFESLMGKLGIQKDDYVVVYGPDGKDPFTLSLFWLLEYFGHQKISYLNGGLAKWNKENRKATGEETKITQSAYKADAPNESMWVNADYVLKNLQNKNVSIVDARDSEEYTGKKNIENNKRTGHIPGAINMDYYVTNFKKDGTLKSADDLKTIYGAKGITTDKEIVSYCQGGVRAANDYFILKHILGYKNVKVYVGSWGEWGNRLDPEKYPVEK